MQYGVGLLLIPYFGILDYAPVVRSFHNTGGPRGQPLLDRSRSFLGFAVFGPQGAAIGPLIICLAMLIYGGLGFSRALFPSCFRSYMQAEELYNALLQ